MALEIGDVFSIKVKSGYGFIQFVGNLDTEIIRVLEPIKETQELSQIEIDIKERFVIGFPLKAALRRKIIDKIAKYDLPRSFKIPFKSRSKFIVRGEFLGWHIVDNKSLKRKLQKQLSKSDLELSPHGIINDSLLITYLETDWRLDNWK